MYPTVLFAVTVKEYLKTPCIVRYSVTIGKIVAPFCATLPFNRANMLLQLA